MSVPKSRRQESRFEAQHQFYKLRHEVTNLVLNDFGFSERKYRQKMEKYRNDHSKDQNIDDVVARWETKNESFKRWFIDEEGRAVIDLMREAGEMGMFINQKKTRVFRLCDTYKFLQIRYSLSPTGKVIKRINPKAVTRERRRMKAYKHLMDDGKITFADVEQACKSWMGDYARIMSRDQINHMKSHYKALFGKELSWKPKSSSRTGRK